jgi:hypothetical protein
MRRTSLLALLCASVRGDRYELMGNGWCLARNGQRIHLGDDPFRPEVRWQPAAVGLDGSAASCESKCSARASCIGYMVEDAEKCDIIQRTDSHASGGIDRVDGEKRNHCWTRVKEAARDMSSGSCVAVARWPDGREEKRDCHVLK